MSIKFKKLIFNLKIYNEGYSILNKMTCAKTTKIHYFPIVAGCSSSGVVQIVLSYPTVALATEQECRGHSTVLHNCIHV